MFALLFVLIAPSSALAWDSPLEPVTPLSDNTQEHGLGLVPSPGPVLSSAAIADIQAGAADLPASVDLTADAMPVGDQGQVNSCAAWATTYGAMGYWMNKQDIDGGALAPMFTYSQVTNGANVGTTLPSHMDIAKSMGVDVLSDYPQGNHNFSQKPSDAQKLNAQQWKLTAYTNLTNQAKPGTTITQDAIKTALADGNPVVIAMPVYQNFYNVTTTNHGLYTAISGANKGFHAVTAYGYDASGLRIENQWGTYWGDSGWATLGWGFVNQYVVESRSVQSMVDPDPQPKLIANPSISGTTKRGQTLTANPGRYTASPTDFDYQWQRDNGANWDDINGATDATYVAVQDDVTHKLRVQVTASNADGEVTGTSAAVGPITPVAPTSTEAPVLSGTAKRGEVLTVTKGQWTDNPTSWTYIWQREKAGVWATISGATTTSFTLTATDLTAKLRVSITAKNAIGSSAAALSNVIGPIAANAPVNSAEPTISGTVERGSVLTAAPGTWAGAGNTYKYQWQRYANSTWVNITSGGTAATYTPALADEGMKLRVQVTATNSDGTATALADETVAVAKSLPEATAIPAPTGTVSRASALIAKPGTWEGVGNIYKYQWQRKPDGGSWTAITGATAVSYTLQVVDKGANIRVAVIATNVDGTATDYSEEVGPVDDAPPVNSVVPVLTGSAARASTLTATTGSWIGPGNVYTYQWQKDAGNGWADIAAATKNSYVLQKTDVESTVRVKVTATNPDGAVAAFSIATAEVAAAPPVNTIAPLLTGTVARTKPLTATNGSWTGPGNVFTYQWQREVSGSWVDITGATSATYVLGSDDTGKKVRVKVTATNPDAAVSAFSVATAAVGLAVPVQGAAPAASGTARSGMTVSSTSGSWTPAGATYAYQWQVDSGSGFEDIDGATTNTYLLTDDEAGAKVRTKVTATNGDGSTVGYSNALGPVLSTPVNTQAPAVTGTLTDAAVLTASNGTWTSAGNLAHTYKYQWVRCAASAVNATACTSIAGAINGTYTTVAADVGAKVAVKVTATNSQNVPAVANSALTNAIEGRALTNVSVPEITGVAGVKEKLTATSGTWSVTLTKAAYQWKRCAADGTACVNITGATANTYTAVQLDVGKTLVVAVAATSPGRSAAAESEPSDEIAPLPLPSTDTPVAITGTPARQQSLKASMPPWEGYATAYTYEWQRCDADGDNCVAITGAKGNAYVLTKADEESTIRVKMGATNTTGTGTSTSDQTTAVAAVEPTNTVVPALTGTAVQNQTLTGGKGTWTTTTDTTYAFAWQRCAEDGSGCVAISGATATTYKLTASDIDTTVKVVVTATNPDGTASASSVISAKVKAAPPAASPIPTLAGTAQVGKVVTATLGTWTFTTETPKVTFWRCTTTCTAIVTSTDKTYTLVQADSGFKIKASVTGVGAGGSTTVYATAVLGPVKAATAGAVLAAASPVSLKGSKGTVLAKVAAKTPAAGGTATVTVTPTKTAKGYKAWACPTTAAADDWQPCTTPVKLGSKATKIKVAVDAGEKINVIVAKTK